jgi:hypothetical protein
VLAVQRWIDPQILPLAAGKRIAALLKAEQFTGLPNAASIGGYVVTFFQVTWDEQRAFWPGTNGRVVPVACGVSIRINAATVRP